jgi:hypothetical protein
MGHYLKNEEVDVVLKVPLMPMGGKDSETTSYSFTKDTGYNIVKAQDSCFVPRITVGVDNVPLAFRIFMDWYGYHNHKFADLSLFLVSWWIREKVLQKLFINTKVKRATSSTFLEYDMVLHNGEMLYLSVVPTCVMADLSPYTGNFIRAWAFEGDVGWFHAPRLQFPVGMNRLFLLSKRPLLASLTYLVTMRTDEHRDYDVKTCIEGVVIDRYGLPRLLNRPNFSYKYIGSPACREHFIVGQCRSCCRYMTTMTVSIYKRICNDCRESRWIMNQEDESAVPLGEEYSYAWEVEDDLFYDPSWM